MKPSPLAMIASGLLVTGLLVGVPLAFVGARLPGATGVFAMLPLATLAACVLGPWGHGARGAGGATPAANDQKGTPGVIAPPAANALAAAAGASTHPPAWLSVGLFPVSHLPILLAHPSLGDVRLYHGASGFAALGGAAVAFAFWLRATRPRLPVAHRAPESRPARPAARMLTVSTSRPTPTALIAWGVAILLLGAYLVPALRRHTPPEAALLAIGLGILSVAFVVGWGGAARLDVMFEPGRRASALAELAADRRPTAFRLVVGLVALALGIGLALAWYLGGLG